MTNTAICKEFEIFNNNTVWTIVCNVCFSDYSNEIVSIPFVPGNYSMELIRRMVPISSIKAKYTMDINNDTYRNIMLPYISRKIKSRNRTLSDIETIYILGVEQNNTQLTKLYTGSKLIRTYSRVSINQIKDIDEYIHILIDIEIPIIAYEFLGIEVIFQLRTLSLGSKWYNEYLNAYQDNKKNKDITMKMFGYTNEMLKYADKWYKEGLTW